MSHMGKNRILLS
ncbi:unnamed protein product [Staurois parvus]|uniref:Uncharacterized protein n=1 Tax=Staurois parvus TaxID=386267 RepID=A0ABN9C1N9_9NEOB|nr:unnamed protein product [Staurois parvus]